MKDSSDILVVGGGPGGAVTARKAAEAGLSVLLVEKRSAVGIPVRSGESIGKDELLEFIDADQRFISAEINSVSLIEPDGSVSVSTKGIEYILDRKVFDRELIWRAAEAGAEIQVHARASAPIMEGEKVCGAVIEQHGKTYDVRAKIVIAADGVESKFAKWAGIDTTIPQDGIMSCVQYVVNDIDIDEKTKLFYILPEEAPNGYIWIFPKGKRCANIGVGIPGTDGYKARGYLDSFIEKKFPNGKITELSAGGVPVCGPLKETAADGLLVVGDAARLSDSVTRRGIYNAMFTGRLAAEVAILAVESGNSSKEFLVEYDKAWRDSKIGKSDEIKISIHN